MLENFKPQDLLNKIFNIQKDLFPDEVEKPNVVQTHYLNEFSYSENSVRLLFDQKNFKILHISENMEKLGGYPIENFYDLNLLFALKALPFEHIDFMYVWVKWAVEMHLKYGNSLDAKQVMCGIKARHKNGHIGRLLFRHYPLETTEKGVAKIAAITIDDVTHLMKSDFYWGRIECGIEKRDMYHLVSTNKVYHTYDILTDREKSILKLLAEGKESKEIGAEVFISSHTVDNHRRNMINKIGVRDTTGLIQICKMTGIIYR